MKMKQDYVARALRLYQEGYSLHTVANTCDVPVGHIQALVRGLGVQPAKRATYREALSNMGLSEAYIAHVCNDTGVVEKTKRQGWRERIQSVKRRGCLGRNDDDIPAFEFTPIGERIASEVPEDTDKTLVLGKHPKNFYSE